MALDAALRIAVEAALGPIGAHEPVGRSGETWRLELGGVPHLLKPIAAERRPAAVAQVLGSLASRSPPLSPRLRHAVELPRRPCWYGVFEWAEGLARPRDAPDWPGAWDRALQLLAIVRTQPLPDDGLPSLVEHWLERLGTVRWHDAMAELLWARLQQQVPDGPEGLAHGDFAPQNLVWLDERALLVDWEEVGRAPAELDAGWLLALSSMGATPALPPTTLRARLLDEGLDADRLWWSWGLGLLRLLYRSRELPLPTSVVTAMAQHIRAQIGALL